jgi:hypothetical protein
LRFGGRRRDFGRPWGEARPRLHGFERPGADLACDLLVGVAEGDSTLHQRLGCVGRLQRARRGGSIGQALQARA